MAEEKLDFTKLEWLCGRPRSAEEVSRCEWLSPRALVNVTLSLQTFEIPQDPLLIGAPKQQLMAQVPMLQGQPMMVLVCRCPELLDYVKAEQNPAIREQIREVIPRTEFCQICAFWKEKHGLPPKKEELQAGGSLRDLPWYGKIVCFAFLFLGLFAAALMCPVAYVRSVIRQWRKEKLSVLGEGKLPTTSELTGCDPEFTGDLSTEEFIRKVRRG
jgi:hypothetical protein